MGRKRQVAVHKDYLVVDDKPLFVIGGDFNYARTPRRNWRDRLLKMRSAGFNTITFYVAWDFHEHEFDKWEWSGDKDLGAFIDLIDELGMFAVARFGPFIHAEWRNGGLPQWLLDKLGPNRVRTNDPEYLEYTKRWYDQILAIVEPRLITRGGSILLVQLENELGSAGSKGDDIHRGSEDPEENAQHVLHYYNLIREHGVDVPVIDISHWPGKERMENLVDSGGCYPAACFSCDGEIPEIDKNYWPNHKRPKVTIETGPGMMVRFFDWPPYKNTTSYQGPIIGTEMVEALTLIRIAEGCNGINYYIFADGWHPDDSNERMLPERDMNLQAPITSVGSLRDKYRTAKRLGWFLRSFEQEVLGATPNQDWVTTVSYGKSHPGWDQTGDLFDNYHGEGSEMAEELRHVRKVVSAARCTRGLNLSESNFLIMLNIKRHGSHWLRDIRVSTSSGGIPCETFREYPRRTQLDLPPQQGKIMPFYVRIQPRTFLEYSTADLLDRRPFGSSGTQVVLYGAENATVETAVVAETNCRVRHTGECVAMWESPNTLTLIARPTSQIQVNTLDMATPVRIVHVTREMAGYAWDIASPGAPLVSFSNLNILESNCADGKTTVKCQAMRDDFFMNILSPEEPVITAQEATIDGVFDSESGVFSASGTVKRPQPVLSFTKRLERTTHIWECDVSPEMLSGMQDLILKVNYQGACARAYLDDRLISDHYFGRFLYWEIGLRDWLSGSQKLRLEFEDTTEVNLELIPVMDFSMEISWQ